MMVMMVVMVMMMMVMIMMVICSTSGCSRLLLVASHWNTAPFSSSLTTRLMKNRFKTLYSHTTKGYEIEKGLGAVYQGVNSIIV